MKFLKRLNLKKTWPYLLAMLILELFCIFILISMDYGITHYEFIDDVCGTIGGIDFTYRQIIVFIGMHLTLFLIFTFVKSLWVCLFEIVIKKMRSKE